VGLVQVMGVRDVQVYRFNCSNNRLTKDFNFIAGSATVILACLLVVQNPYTSVPRLTADRLHVEDATICNNTYGWETAGWARQVGYLSQTRR
jgi:hypothetical protein